MLKYICMAAGNTSENALKRSERENRLLGLTASWVFTLTMQFLMQLLENLANMLGMD